MGNDGGSIPTRRELVREAAKNPSTAQVKSAQREVQEHFWTTCPLSHEALKRPIVSDCVGNLYNKDAVLRFLLPGDEVEGISSKADCEGILCGRVKGLRDVVEVKFELDTQEPENGTGTDKRETWVCPITARVLGPGVKAVYLVPCGHVFAEEAVKQLKEDKCLQCNEPYTEENVIPILPPQDSDKQRLIARGHKLAEQGLSHSLKKAPGKKRKKAAAVAGDTTTTSEQESKAKSTSNGIKNPATAMLTARVLDEENERKKKRKAGTNENLQSLFSKDSGSKGSGDFMTRGYSIPGR